MAVLEGMEGWKSRDIVHSGAVRKTTIREKGGHLQFLNIVFSLLFGEVVVWPTQHQLLYSPTGQLLDVINTYSAHFFIIWWCELLLLFISHDIILEEFAF
jgi:hypothetical protein